MSRFDEDPAADEETEEEPAVALASVMHELRDEVEVLRMAIDELREEIQTATRNLFHSSDWKMRISSMARDPCAEDFGERLNKVDGRTRESLRREEVESLPEQSNAVSPAAKNDAPPAPDLTSEKLAATSEPTADRATEHSSHQTEHSPGTSTRSVGKQQPLYMRIASRVMTDIVRAFGYETLTQEEARRRTEPLFEKYGREAVLEAAAEICTAIPTQSGMWCLTYDARKAARTILGPPPAETACGASKKTPASRPAVPPISESPADQSQAAASDETTDVKAARKVVLGRFREHLEATGEIVAEVPAEALRLLGERGRMVPDLMLGDGPPYELLAVRRGLSAMQRNDMQEWLNVSDIGRQATRAWPRKAADGWKWTYEVVANRDDEEQPDAAHH